MQNDKQRNAGNFPPDVRQRQRLKASWLNMLKRAAGTRQQRFNRQPFKDANWKADMADTVGQAVAVAGTKIVLDTANEIDTTAYTHSAAPNDHLVTIGTDFDGAWFEATAHVTFILTTNHLTLVNLTLQYDDAAPTVWPTADAEGFLDDRTTGITVTPSMGKTKLELMVTKVFQSLSAANQNELFVFALHSNAAATVSTVADRAHLTIKKLIF